MSTNAVTTDASAVSTEDRMQEALDSGFLPEDPSYRRTGQFSDKKEPSAAFTEKKTDSPSETEEAPASSESETAAASEAAPTQERKGPQKTAASSESRWAKLSRENRELRETLERLKTPHPRETVQESQPAKEVKGDSKPKIDDVDSKTGQPKYKTYADYEDARDEWLRKDTLREFQETSAKTAKEQQLAQMEQTIQKTINERVTKARKNYPDYDETIAEALSTKDGFNQDAIFYTKGSAIDQFLLDSDHGHDILYHIAKNLDETKHIFERNAQGQYLLNPIRQVRELAKIESRLADKPHSSSAPKVTQAPPPPRQVSGKGTVSKDAVEEAVEAGDFESYSRAENARALARRKGK